MLIQGRVSGEIFICCWSLYHENGIGLLWRENFALPRALLGSVPVVEKLLIVVRWRKIDKEVENGPGL